MSETEVASVYLGLHVSAQDLTGQITKAAQDATKQTTNIFSGLGKKIGGLLGTAAVTKFTKDCIEMGSNLTEVQNVVDTAFGNMVGSANEFASNAMENFGMSELSAKKYLGVFGQMSSAMGITGKSALEMAENVTALTGDVASFYNLGTDEAYTKLKSIWTGETETLKDLGVVMTQTNLDQYALNNGFGKTTAKMTEQEKVMLRYQYVTNALSNASGDFAKTQDSWANQTRIMTLRFQQFQATLGKGFIALFTPIVRGINSCLIGLQKLAEGFTNLILMLTGADISSSTGSIATDLSGLGDSATDVADSVSGIGNAASDTAKKIKGSLSGLDELNNLSIDDSSDSGSSGGGISAGGTGTSSAATSMVEEVGKVSDSLAKFKQLAEELKDIFKTGFKEGLGKDFTASILRQKKHILSIKDSLKDIFTDPQVTNAAYNYAKSVSRTLGIISGSAVSIGASISENLLGGFDSYLSKNSDFIKDKFANILDLGAVFNEEIGKCWEFLARISEVFRSDSAKGITGDIIAIIGNGFLEARELALRYATDIASILIDPLSDNTDKIKEALEGTLTSVQKFTDTVSEDFTKLCSHMSDTYDEHIHPMMESFKNGLSEICSKMLDTYNEYVAPIVDRICEKASQAWDEHIHPVFMQVIDNIGKVADLIKLLWENVVQPFVSWIVQDIIPAVAPVIETIADTVIQCISDVMDIIGDLQKLLGDIIDFITCVFKGDWDGAWTSLVDSFKDIFSLIYDVAKTPINLLIGAINQMITSIQAGINALINSVNKLSFTTPDWVPGIGGKTFGFSIPTVSAEQIPYLAQGGYVKPNTPQLAMIGDNRHQGEVVAPEDKLRQMAAEAVRMSSGSTSQEVIELLSRIIRLLESGDKGDILIQVDGREIFKVTRKQAREYFDRTGNPAFDF